MHPDDEVLAALALGEPVAANDRAHAETCPQCAAAIVELRETVALVGGAARDELVAPPDAVWQRIAGELSDDSDAGFVLPAMVEPPASPSATSEGTHGAVHSADGRVLPLRGEDARPVPAGGADGSVDRAPAPVAATGSPDELARRRRRPRWGWLLGAAAAGVAIGLAGAQLPGLVSPPAVVARASLDTLDTGRRGGRAELLQNRGQALDLQVQVEPLNAGAGYLEVWLINTDLTRMVSVGVLPPDVTQERFAVTRGLIDQGYVIVDISREPYDDKPQHSGDSLLRGSLA